MLVGPLWLVFEKNHCLFFSIRYLSILIEQALYGSERWPVVRSTLCSCRVPELSFQHPHLVVGSQLPVTPGPGEPDACGFHGNLHSHGLPSFPTCISPLPKTLHIIAILMLTSHLYLLLFSSVSILER